MSESSPVLVEKEGIPEELKTLLIAMLDAEHDLGSVDSENEAEHYEAMKETMRTEDAFRAALSEKLLEGARLEDVFVAAANVIDGYDSRQNKSHQYTIAALREAVYAVRAARSTTGDAT